MAESSAQYHEPLERLSAATVEQHRALVSLMEELEAIDALEASEPAPAEAPTAADGSLGIGSLRRR